MPRTPPLKGPPRFAPSLKPAIIVSGLKAERKAIVPARTKPAAPGDF